MRTIFAGMVIGTSVALACGGKSTQSPTQSSSVPVVSGAPSPPSPAASISLTVMDGWTGTPVAGAQVSGEGINAVTGTGGTLQLTLRPRSCVPLDIEAPGFLHRRTCAKPPSITLWSVADEAEAAATTKAAFTFGDRLTDQSAYAAEYGVLLRTDLRQRPEVVAVWAAAAEEIRTRTSGKLAIPMVQYLTDEGYIVSVAGSPPACRHPWFTWNFTIAGFCWDPTSAYFITDITVAPSSLDHVEVALRALLYSYALRPHEMPGLMNVSQPALELSTFERKTLRMMSLRWPTPVTWPDIDQIPYN